MRPLLSLPRGLRGGSEGASRCCTCSLRACVAMVDAATLTCDEGAEPHMASSPATVQMDIDPPGALHVSNLLEGPCCRQSRLIGLRSVRCVSPMGSWCNVSGPRCVELVWRSRSSRNGARCGLEQHGARGRGARVCDGAVAGRAIAGVRKRRNESYLGCGGARASEHHESIQTVRKNVQ